MKVIIDTQSGFCFGVVTAIRKAEEELQKGGKLYCLGEIVHNEQEVERLAKRGLETINKEQFETLHDARVFLRAHGEPPQTYITAQNNNIEIIDASCPVVRSLQQKIKRQYEKAPDGQIVIFGKHGHAEVVGLQGQTDNKAIVIESSADLNQLDFNKDIYLFSQTTKSVEEFHKLIEAINLCIGNRNITFEWHDTICAQVRNRVKHIKDFATSVDRVVFVGGRNSSNGKVLFEHCREANSNTIFISDPQEIDGIIIGGGDETIGICGATSTPLWLMEQCAKKIKEQNK